ncbi:hypothetical protein [Pseudoduganella chitinolytica]|uniref:Uncharacterized protein n=1 Tax=Pseudoduganella chitinolytica TaxID=34070 RepID=A0ABY8BDR5_9BURK|nr:hypothetical protein [Pseudoduganella chitinolytica]WEF33533.1 hypothetical protein PX653_01700 [Pseudoduganella chitinolytica]
MTDPMASALEQLGVAPDAARAIGRDVRHGDARSLCGELLLRGLWSAIIDETQPLDATRNGGAALRRLLDSGADPADLLDLVRETQVDLIYNVAQLIDDPAEALGLELPVELELSVRLAGTDSSAAPIYSLHSSLMELDPSGRHGEPRSPVVRQLQGLDEEVRGQLLELIAARKLSAAAALWKKQVGGDLAGALSAVQSLSGGG